MWSRTGVGTQMQMTSLVARAAPSAVKPRRPVVTPLRKLASSTPGTTSSPAARASTRSASTSMPVTSKPASAAAQASDSPT